MTGYASKKMTSTRPLVMSTGISSFQTTGGVSNLAPYLDRTLVCLLGQVKSKKSYHKLRMNLQGLDLQELVIEVALASCPGQR